ITQVLPQLASSLAVDVAAHGDDRVAVGGSGGGLQQRGHGGLLTWSGEPAGARSTAPVEPLCRNLPPDCGYGVATGRTLVAWGPFWPWVMSNSTAWPSSSEPPSWMALTWTKTSLPDSGWMKP